MRKPIAILSADWHLSHKPPRCREEESNWYETQKVYLRQVADIANELPIIVAGDIFDKWNPSLELVNFAHDYMPRIIAVPGQHDLKNHRYEDLVKSGYYNLSLGKILTDVSPEFPVTIGESIRIWGFPWGKEPEPNSDPQSLYIDIALVHKYMYIKGTGYPDAPEDARVGKLASQFKGYNIVVSGDNHVPHNVMKNGIRFVNCGSLVRRSIDQIDYKPAVWKLYDDCTVEPVYLDISRDVMMARAEKTFIRSEAIGELVEAIREVRGETVDFDEAIQRVIRKGTFSEEVVQTLKELLDE